MDFGNAANGRRRLRKLIETWVRFGEFLKSSLGKEGVQSAQEEQFLALKARIAHLLPVLSVIQRGAATDPEALAAMRDITDMLNSLTTLSTPGPLSKEEAEEIIAQWHRIFIFLNKLEGALKDRRYGFLIRADRKGLEAVSAPRGSLAGAVGRVFIAIVIVVAAAVIVAALLGITPEQARDALQRGIGVILGQSATGAAVARSGGAEVASQTEVEPSGTTSESASGSTEPEVSEKSVTETKPGRSTEELGVKKPFIRTKQVERKSRVPLALRPLFRQYGRHFSMIVFAVFLAAIVFLFFVRVR